MIENYLKESSRFCIFGAGSIANKVKNTLQTEGKTVSSFIVTSSSPVNEIDNIKIIAIEEKDKIDTSIPVIIGVFNREPNAFLGEIIYKLRSLGFEKIISFPEFHSVYHNILGDNFWLTDKKYYSQKIAYYKSTLDLFKDQLSYENYNMVIDYLQTFDPSVLIKPDFENQYFPKDINVWDGKDGYYDLGSYDGSNILDAFERKGILDLAIAFEPDLVNFQKIVQNPFLKMTSKSLFLYPCGVWSETTHLRFNIGAGESSSFKKSGTHIVPVVKIDEVLHSRAGYIKFDVEGAEIEALLGARNTITNYKPS